MKSFILYIASSLDGFIARKDGSIDWLDSIALPKENDYGYDEFMRTIDVVVMGRKTYDQVVSFKIDWPYKGKKTFILSHTIEKSISDEIRITNKTLKNLIVDLKELSRKDIWVVGGGEIITAFLNENSIDKIILFVIPIILGDGIPLFPNHPKESTWKLVETQSYKSGVVMNSYEKSK